MRPIKHRACFLTKFQIVSVLLKIAPYHMPKFGRYRNSSYLCTSNRRNSLCAENRSSMKTGEGLKWWQAPVINEDPESGQKRGLPESCDTYTKLARSEKNYDSEVGYWVGKPFWNKGICTEALKLMLDYCINEKHFENIWADHFTGNPASGRVMEKWGFSDTGMLNQCSQLVGGDKDMVKVFKYYR